jgi:phosphatidylethanolamine/phosphatidyl-N-methylethanolamine N-methyltransferase
MSVLESWYRIRYSLYAPLYDPFVGRAFMAQRKRSIEIAEIQPQHKILIVGAGTGLDLHYLSPSNNITAIDISNGMLQKLRKRSDKLKVPVLVEKMDARNLSFENGTFDIILLHMIVAVIPDYKSAIKEVERVVKGGGIVMVFDKFLPKFKKPNIFRRLINPVAILVASNLNLELSDLIADVNLKVVIDEKAGWNGLLRIVKLIKLADNRI